jgi:hypothetical protein
VGGACLGEILDALPDFGGAQIQILDRLEQVGRQPYHDLLHACVRCALRGGVYEELLYQRFDVSVRHVSLRNVSLVGVE